MSAYLAPPSTPSSSVLPPEFVDRIVEMCDQAGLAKTPLVSRSLFLLSRPLLYRHLVMSGLVNDPFLVLLTPGGGDYGAIGEAAPESTAEELAADPSSPLPPSTSPVGLGGPSLIVQSFNQNLLYTETLIIDYFLHDPRFPHSLDMPNLRVLRVLGDACNFSRDYLTHLCRMPFCDSRRTIMSDLRPSTLILGGERTGTVMHGCFLWHPARGCGDERPFPPPFVKRLIFMVGVRTRYKSTPYPVRNILRRIPDTLGRVSLVLEPRRFSMDGTWKRSRAAAVEEGEEPDDASTFFDEISHPLSGGAQVGELVGLELVNKKWLGSWTAETAKEEIRRRVAKRRREKGVDHFDAIPKGAAVVFMSRAEFQERERREGNCTI